MLPARRTWVALDGEHVGYIAEVPRIGETSGSLFRSITLTMSVQTPNPKKPKKPIWARTPPTRWLEIAVKTPDTIANQPSHRGSARLWGTADRAAEYYTALLINVGCHSDAHEQAKWFGDDEYIGLAPSTTASLCRRNSPGLLDSQAPVGTCNRRDPDQVRRGSAMTSTGDGPVYCRAGARSSARSTRCPSAPHRRA
jgi:hypothetical protein